MPAVIEGAAAPDFARDIRPLLETACVSCHGPDKQKGNLRLDRRQAAFGVGESGDRVIIPHNSAESALMQLVTAADPDERMPRDEDPLTSGQIELLRRWIDAGAPWPIDDIDAVAAGAKSEMRVASSSAAFVSFKPTAMMHGTRITRSRIITVSAVRKLTGRSPVCSRIESSEVSSTPRLLSGAENLAECR